ncbi:MAG: VOC family protein [Candidatus Sulfotelmatobacter sp.]
MQVSPHIHFNGDCEAALKFYEQTLGAKITFMMPFEGSPASNQVPEAWQRKILHASIKIGDNIITAGDAPPGYFHKPQGFALTIGIPDPGEAERLFKALSDGGSVQMPMQETFWAARFGMLTDHFGIPWMINCAKAV